MFNLAWKNVARRKNRVFVSCAITIIMIMALTTVWNVFSVINAGLTLSSDRMGADIVICPNTVSGDAQDIMYTGSTEMYYMDEKAVTDALPEDLTEKYTTEFYLQTLPGAGCCATNNTYRIIGIDSSTDFLISPWIDQNNLTATDENEIIIGNDIGMEFGDMTTILSNTFTVKGVLYKTGTALDKSLYVDIAKARKMAENTFSADYFDYKDTDELVSSCFVKLKDGVTAEQFREAFNPDGSLPVKVFAVSAARDSMLEQIDSLFEVMGAVVVILLLVSVIALYSQYSMLIKERKKETGYLRAIGMQRSQIIRASFMEVAIQAGISGLIGGILGCLLFYPIINSLMDLFSISTGEWGAVNIITHIIGALVISLIISACAAGIPAISNSKIEPHQALTEGELM